MATGGPHDYERVGQGRSRVLIGARDLALQILIVAGAAFLYFAVRGVTEGNEDIAVRNAQALLRLEKQLGLALEESAQATILDTHLLVTVSNWVYIWGHWPVIITVFVVLYVTRREYYRLLLRSMLISGAIGLVIFAFYPVAPPRLMPDGIFVDTVTELSNSYRVLQPPSLVNKFAALPSLHVGWNLLVGIVVFRSTRKVWIRAFAVVSPALMICAVVFTGNHYVLDAVLGSAVALVGFAGAAWLARYTHRGDALLHEREVIEDHAGDPQAACMPHLREIGETPHEQHVAPLQEPARHALGEQIVAHAEPVDRSMRW